MRRFPEDKYDQAEIGRIGAPDWMLTLLKLNPSYPFWGPGEDYMTGREGWDGDKEFRSWAEFQAQGFAGLDELNEVVNFYFEIDRDSIQCPVCGGDGYNAHPETKAIVNSFYRTMNDTGREWQYDLTSDEMLALYQAGRFYNATKCPKASELRDILGPMGHDSINRSILTRTRLQRLNLPVTCDRCEGHGYVYTEPSPHMNVVLWVCMLHPRKGASRGIRITLTPSDVPAAIALVKEAGRRMREKFAPIESLKFGQ